MRFGSYFVGERASYGVIVDGGVVDLGCRVGSRYADLRSLLTADAAADEIMQAASVGRMLFRIETFIAYFSTFVPLVAGDIIATGTPGGVGHARKPPVYLKQDDIVEVEINKIGVLRNHVIKEV